MGGASRQTGTGLLAAATLITALSEELHASPLDVAFLDDGTLTLKDFRFGIVAVSTKEAIPRFFLIDDPEFDLIIERVGSGFNIESVRNSTGRMAELLGLSQETFAILRMGQQISPQDFLGSGGLLQDASLGSSNSVLSFEQGPALLPSITSYSDGSPPSDIVFVSLTLPTPAVTIIAISGDTGTSAADFVTSDTTLMVSGSNGPLAAGESIQLSSDGGLTWHDVTQTSATTWSYDDTATSHTASFSYTVQIVDAADKADATASQGVTIDTTAPTAALAITAIGDDTGSSEIDFVTNDTTLVVSGSNGALAAGESIQLSSDGGLTWHDVTQTSATTWSYDDTATSHTASFAYTARIVDAAGNIGTTASQGVTIDTTGPTAALAITAIGDDTGSSAVDFVTSDTTLVVSGSNGALAAGESIQLSGDGGLTWHDVTQTSATTWSYDDTATSHTTSFSYTARIVDAAGNIGTTASQGVTIDTTGPTAALAITAIGDDTGSSAVDFITSDTTLVVSGSNGALAAGESIQLSGDGGLTWHDVTQSSATTWSYDDTATSHTTSFSYTARIIDAAGNIGTTASQGVTIDTTGPTAALAITAIGDDTGSLGGRLRHQRHHARGVRQQRCIGGRREHPAVQRRWPHLARRHPDLGDHLEL